MEIGVYNAMRERLSDFYINSCAIRDRDSAYILFEKYRDDQSEEPSLRVGYYSRSFERKWGYQGFGNMYRALSCVVRSGNNELVVVDLQGSVVSQQEGETKDFDVEDALPIINNVSILRVRDIDGSAYAVGSLRTVLRREGINSWEILSGNDLAVRDLAKKEDRKFGFQDIAGFSSDDIYACGGRGDVWHFDGDDWSAIDVPTNAFLYTICCGEDGNVYIGGSDGTLLSGRDSDWSLISGGADSESDFAGEILDLAWFKDQLYLGVRYQGLFVLGENGPKGIPGVAHIVGHEDPAEAKGKLSARTAELMKLKGANEQVVDIASMPISIEGEGVLSPGAFHSFDTDGEILIAGGGDSVVLFDGKNWRTFYSQVPNDDAGAL